ncbi:hypothetical protein JTE90_011387 [Oedothorax gibbosus]|uniref:Protein SSUH2 homolog n=1 Tax=Oedothorax gibbosus TaxID=931172 RepID=A0AAV6VK90_9ARAC|nr:hypothetical protein JTE90_011387 [Oedothorax gibbosus]
MNDSKPPPYEASFAASAVTSSAPSINKGFEPDEGISNPPTAPPYDATPVERPPFISFGTLTDQELRDACFEYIDDKCCYGSRFIKDMTLIDIYASYTFHYKLETFCERRESKWTSVAYYGQRIDGPENGPVPSVWDMRVREPTKFKNDRTYEELPHTATVKRCTTCHGDGRVRCSNYYGDGWNQCYLCGGRGTDREEERCSNCNGRGKKKCSRCDGRGRVDCSPCNGHGKLKYYRELIVTWSNYVDDFVSDTMKLPKELIKEVNGKRVFREQNNQVFPFYHIPDAKVNEASSRFIQKSKTSHNQEQILEQRQTVWAVPLTRAKYLWKRWQDEFYVFGLEKKVYFDHYPQQCCYCTCC